MFFKPRRIIHRHTVPRDPAHLLAQAEAIKQKGLEVGIPVTNGAVTGKIIFIDPETSDIRIHTGIRTVVISPLMLERL